MDTDYKYSEITDKIIKAVYTVYNELGHGFLEKVYENALAMEIKDLGLSARQQTPLKVYFKGRIVGDYVADLVVEEKVVVEIKAGSNLEKAHEAQIINYLKATKMEVGLLINFGPDIKFKRKVFSNAIA